MILSGMYAEDLFSHADLVGFSTYKMKWLMEHKPLPATLTLVQAMQNNLPFFRSDLICSVFGVEFSVQCRYCGNIWPASRTRCKTCAGDIE